MGRRAAAGLTALGARVVAFGDRNPALHGAASTDCRCSRPEIGALHAHDVVLVASTMFDSAICEDLGHAAARQSCRWATSTCGCPTSLRRANTTTQGSGDRPRNRAAIEEACAARRRRIAARLAGRWPSSEPRQGATRRDQDAGDHLLRPERVRTGRRPRGGRRRRLRRRYARVDPGVLLGAVSLLFAFEPDTASYARLAAWRPPTPRASPPSARPRPQDRKRPPWRHRGSGLAGARRDRARGRECARSEPRRLLRRPRSLVDQDGHRGRRRPKPFAARRACSESAAPTLAVSAYHFPADLWAIPLLIKRLMPHSDLYLRHYSREVDDTVCYAIPG